jgi:hypothetical protein
MGLNIGTNFAYQVTGGPPAELVRAQAEELKNGITGGPAHQAIMNWYLTNQQAVMSKPGAGTATMGYPGTEALFGNQGGITTGRNLIGNWGTPGVPAGAPGGGIPSTPGAPRMTGAGGGPGVAAGVAAGMIINFASCVFNGKDVMDAVVKGISKAVGRGQGVAGTS